MRRPQTPLKLAAAALLALHLAAAALAGMACGEGACPMARPASAAIASSCCCTADCGRLDAAPPDAYESTSAPSATPRACALSTVTHAGPATWFAPEPPGRAVGTAPLQTPLFRLHRSYRI